MIVDLDEPELFMRAILALLVLLPVGCEPDQPPPRVYLFDDITWAHPAMSALVERSLAVVQTRHPDWVWVPLREGGALHRIMGGLCPPQAARLDVGIWEEQCTDENHRLWLELERPEGAYTPSPTIEEFRLNWCDDAPIAGGSVSASFNLYAGAKRPPNYTHLTVRTSARAAMYPDANMELMDADDMGHWKALMDLGHPLDERYGGVSPGSYMALELVGYMLRGPEQLQRYQIGRIRWERDIGLGAQPFQDGRTFEQFLLEVMPWYSSLSGSWSVRAYDLYVLKMEAVRQERREELRVPLSIAQTESEGMYATLVEVIPPDLITALGLDSASSASP